VVAGHSHQPSIQHSHGKTLLNPGSAGPRRFTLPISLARLHISPQGFRPELMTLTG
jgi:predicted phosphodiesterase